MKRYLLFLLISSSISCLAQFSYGPRVGIGVGIPSIRTYGDVSQFGELAIDSKVNFRGLFGLYMGKQFDSNFFFDVDALFYTNTKIKFNSGSESYDVNYKGWHGNVYVGTKINYNFRGFLGIGYRYPLISESDIQALATFMNADYSYGGSPYINVGGDYFTNKYTVAAVVKFPLNFLVPFMAIEEFSYESGYFINSSVVEIRISPNLNK